jgi:lipid II:glycine glycyltransferase (peptidoglycan interpeptide bridge formation enzyme)
MELFIDDKNQRTKWKDFFNKNSLSTPFQSPEFYDFFNSISGQSSQVYHIENENKIEAICVVTLQKENGIKGYFSRRAIIYGGPLIVENGQELLNKLLLFIYKELKGKVIYIETRNFVDYSRYRSIFAERGWGYLPYLNVQLTLDNKKTEDLLSAMNYNRRREIKLSITEGAIYQEASTVKDVKALYQILENLYRVRVKLPLPHFDYFEKLFLSSIGKVFIVKHNNLIIGGTFCLYYVEGSIFTLYYCGIRDYHKKIFPTHLAILAAIEFGIKNKLKKLDFMGAGKAEEEYGVRNYKTEFGGDLVEHGRFIKICNPFLFILGKLGLAVLKKIKR